ncbi:MAG: cysteine--tRNA ligase [Cognatishimia sp.]|uniref:cysteine--tRNA ligase n=1 Tax=Cognatishimia sp. TaxID=2211648 RepID=UPI003B8BECD6
MTDVDLTIKLHNTKTRKKEVFEPLDTQNVRMYVCGPTVYDRAHLGNARPVVVFDVLNRLLRHVYGADHVTYVRNFTDVDDKINATALMRKEAGAAGTLEELVTERSDETIGWYLKDMGALGAMEPDFMPRATGYIAQMITMIEGLIEKGHAYPDGAGHVLFSVKSYDDYGKLSGRSVDDMIAGARVEVADNKRDPMDFVLWKPSTDDLPGWDSPWGRGRPGWHIECSAMAHDLLGESFDIHGGGNDLQFPHHENEIAQSCCAHPEGEFARYWMHNEMLQVEGKKMSKSLGNFFTVRDLLDKGVPGEVIRFVFLSTHYRKPMDWTARKAQDAEKTLRSIAQVFGGDPQTQETYLAGKTNAPQEVLDALGNDLNTSLALTHIKKYVKNHELAKLDASLRLIGFEPDVLVEKYHSFEVKAGDNGVAKGMSYQDDGSISKDVAELLQSLTIQLANTREKAMETKDFSEVDRLKSGLLSAGVEVRMSKAGVELLPGADFDAAKLEAL